MPDRYTAHDYDAAWQVWDNVKRRSVGGPSTEAGALAEAARLNDLAPKRAKRRRRARTSTGWALCNPHGAITEISLQKPHLDAASKAEGWRIARVRITEIEGGDSHG